MNPMLRDEVSEPSSVFNDLAGVNKAYRKSPGDQGIYETVGLMHRIAEHFRPDPEIRRLAVRIVGQAKSRIALCNMIYAWIKKNIVYLDDIHGIETLQSPLLTLHTGRGDCDDFSILAKCLLQAVGIKSHLTVADYGRGFSHVYLMAEIEPGKMIAFDATAKKRVGYERKPYIRRKIF